MSRHLAVSLVLLVLSVAALVLALTVDPTFPTCAGFVAGLFALRWLGERHWAKRPKGHGASRRAVG